MTRKNGGKSNPFADVPVMNPLQLGGIETSELDNGPGRGVRIAWVNTGAGLRYKVVIDRGLDIADAELLGQSLTWHSLTGVTSPSHSYSRKMHWLRGFYGGLLVSCGPLNTGAPFEENGEAAAKAEADAAAPGDAEQPGVGGALKTSEKDGVVVVIADSDFVYDAFAVQQVQNMENGRVEMQPVNSNLALFENLLEQLAGGDELIRVRSRASNHRPFTRLNSILERVEAEFRPELDKVASEINRIEGERQAIGQNILRSLTQNPDQKGQQEVSEEIGEQVLQLQQQEEEMAVQMRELQRKQYEVNKKIKKEFDSAKNGIILLVTAVLPLLIIIFGIALALSQRVRTAAQ